MDGTKDRLKGRRRFLVRRFQRRDLQEAARVLAGVYREPPYRERWTGRTAFRYISEIAGLDPSSCYAAWSGNELAGVLAGYSYLFRGAAVYYIQELFVAKKWRGRGAAREMLRQAAGKLKGRRIFTLFARNDAPAMRIYRRLGFKEHAHYKFCYVRLPRGRWPADQA